MITKIEVHKDIFKEESNQIILEYEKLESKLKEKLSDAKKKQIKEYCELLKKRHDDLKEASRLKEYKRKSEMLEKRLSVAVCVLL